MDKFFDAITATVDGQPNTRVEDWEYAPLSIPLRHPKAIDMTIPAVDRPTARVLDDLFPARAKMLKEFLEYGHKPHALAIPEIAYKNPNLLSDFSALLKIVEDETNTERETAALPCMEYN